MKFRKVLVERIEPANDPTGYIPDYSDLESAQRCEVNKKISGYLKSVLKLSPDDNQLEAVYRFSSLITDKAVRGKLTREELQKILPGINFADLLKVEFVEGFKPS